MIRDAISILNQLLSDLLKGIQEPQADETLPDPDDLSEEAKKYE